MTDNSPADRSAKLVAAGLTATAAQLSDDVDGLRQEVRALHLGQEQLGRRTERAERVSTRTAVAAVIVLALIALVGLTAYRQLATEDRLAQVVEAERQTRQDILCPLYGLFVGSYAPESRPEGDARDKYNQAFDVIRKAYGQIGCDAESGPLIPPRTPGS